MPRLLEFQRCFATDVLFDAAASAKYLVAGPIPSDVAIRVHRDSVLAALVNAMRLSCPTLSAVVDARFFEQAVRDYARARPPRGACLAHFGDEFAAFLEMYPPASEFPFFGDMVRFDMSIDETNHDLPGTYGEPLSFGRDGAFRMVASLRQLTTKYPVDVIRDEVEAERWEGLEGIDMKPQFREFALWRTESGATVKRLSAPAAAFLKAVRQGADGGAALNSALEHGSSDEVLHAIRSEILTSSICVIDRQ